MKKLSIIISSIIVLFLSTSQAQMISIKHILENVDSHIVKISVEELKAKMESDSLFLLIDLRTKEEYLAGHIKNSIWIPRGFLEFKIQKVTDEPESEIIVYCKGGLRSSLSAHSLMQMGYKNVSNLEGGLREWVFMGHSIYN
ncbi:MAG: rhodanese-like domain-containing protein, partial [Ignavibacteria bacterium]|nr:rhodanese-like domain-containing protein [Ignavibacteria bacterium]